MYWANETDLLILREQLGALSYPITLTLLANSDDAIRQLAAEK